MGQRTRKTKEEEAPEVEIEEPPKRRRSLIPNLGPTNPGRETEGLPGGAPGPGAAVAIREGRLEPENFHYALEAWFAKEQAASPGTVFVVVLRPETYAKMLAWGVPFKNQELYPRAFKRGDLSYLSVIDAFERVEIGHGAETEREVGL